MSQGSLRPKSSRGSHCLASSGFGPSTHVVTPKDVCDDLRIQSFSCFRREHISTACTCTHNHSWRGRATIFSQKPPEHVAVQECERVLEEAKEVFTPETGGCAACAFHCRVLCCRLWGDMDCRFPCSDCQTVGLHWSSLVADSFDPAARSDIDGPASHHAVSRGAPWQDISGGAAGVALQAGRLDRIVHSRMDCVFRFFIVWALYRLVLLPQIDRRHSRPGHMAYGFGGRLARRKEFQQLRSKERQSALEELDRASG